MRRIALVLVAVVLPLSATPVFAAGNVVPHTSLFAVATTLVKTSAFKPGECGDAYATFFSGGSNTGGSGNDLMLGTSGADTLRGSGGNDCIVSGAGIDIVNGGAGTDVCIVGAATPVLNIGGCEVVVRRP